MTLWHVAFLGFLIISSVFLIVNVMCLVTPAAAVYLFCVTGSHYNISVDSVKSRLQNVKSQ